LFRNLHWIIFRINILKRIKWAIHVACMRKMRKIHTKLWTWSEETTCTDGKVILKWMQKKWKCKGMDWIQLAWGWVHWKVLVNTVNLGVPHEGGHFWPAGWLSASEEGPVSQSLVNPMINVSSITSILLQPQCNSNVFISPLPPNISLWHGA